MKKIILFLALCASSLGWAGCTSTMPNVRPTPPMMNIWPNATVTAPILIPSPLLWLQVGGAETYGRFSQAEVQLPMGSNMRGDAWPALDSPQPPRLTLRQGQNITLKHDQPTAPTFLVIELDEQNIILHASVIPAPGNQYTPAASGVYRLSVRAQWHYRYESTYFFNLEVKP